MNRTRFTDMTAPAEQLQQALATVRAGLNPQEGSPEDYAMCAIDTFVDIALRVLRETNPSKIRDKARTVEMKAHLDGTPFIRLSEVTFTEESPTP